MMEKTTCWDVSSSLGGGGGGCGAGGRGRGSGEERVKEEVTQYSHTELKACAYV